MLLSALGEVLGSVVVDGVGFCVVEFGGFDWRAVGVVTELGFS